MIELFRKFRQWCLDEREKQAYKPMATEGAVLGVDIAEPGGDFSAMVMVDMPDMDPNTNFLQTGIAFYHMENDVWLRLSAELSASTQIAGQMNGGNFSTLNFVKEIVQKPVRGGLYVENELEMCTMFAAFLMDHGLPSTQGLEKRQIRIMVDEILSKQPELEMLQVVPILDGEPNFLKANYLNDWIMGGVF